jgi:hypothetical protein
LDLLVSAAPSLLGTFVGAFVGAGLAFLANWWLGRATSRRQWRTNRLNSFVERAYRLVPGFEQAVAAAERGDREEARRILKTIANLTEELGYARASRDDKGFKAAAESVIEIKVALNAEIPRRLDDTTRDVWRHDFGGPIWELYQRVLKLDDAAEDYLFGR